MRHGAWLLALLVDWFHSKAKIGSGCQLADSEKPECFVSCALLRKAPYRATSFKKATQTFPNNAGPINFRCETCRSQVPTIPFCMGVCVCVCVCVCVRVIVYVLCSLLLCVGVCRNV